MTDFSKERERYNKLLKMMESLPPPKNLHAIRVYIALYKPELSPLVEPMLRDASIGSKPAQQIILLLITGFAAGRAFQDANPTAPFDPNGYDV